MFGGVEKYLEEKLWKFRSVYIIHTNIELA
jgi:hypothetical protein